MASAADDNSDVESAVPFTSAVTSTSKNTTTKSTAAKSTAAKSTAAKSTVAKSTAVKSKSSVNEDDELSSKYRSMTPKEHILNRPGMYLGDIHKDAHTIYTVEHTPYTQIIQRELTYIPGFMSIIEEVLVNANDHKYRLQQAAATDSTVIPVTEIRITTDDPTLVPPTDRRITVYNNGDGIDIHRHPKSDLYVPQMIFSELLTSGNYDDEKERVTGGQNGIGVKLTNIYSREFTITTIDHRRKLKYTQIFTNNMSIIHPPIITACREQPYTVVSFIPDYTRFQMHDEGLSAALCSLIEKRAMDLFVTSGIQIYYNDKPIFLSSFANYMQLYLPPDYSTATCEPSPRWKIGACLTPSQSFQQVSFVNGIITSRGGKHVEYITKQLCKKISEILFKKHRATIKDNVIKDTLMVFVNCIIANPTFDSQTKETLTSNSRTFGSICTIPDSFITELLSNGAIIDRVMALHHYHDTQLLKKTDGKKVKRIFDIPKLNDAHFAGDRKQSSKCTLILTEGDSAKSMAVIGISSIPGGYDYFGIYPLRGKLLNTRDKTEKELADNTEICDIKKILGLQEGVHYTDTSTLRYGRIMLMTDADPDGSHIKGLVMNFISKWPSLMQLSGFITGMLTPIVKARKGGSSKSKKRGSEQVKSFYTLSEFNDWYTTANTHGWEVKYYKGLGTSTPEEAVECFANFKQVIYHWTDETDNSIDLAFNKSRADDRKTWLSTYDFKLILDFKQSGVTFTEFIDKDLIHFSNYDNVRSIPSLCDGLKPSQRKIMYCCFKRNLIKEIKVVQLAGYVGEHGAYHHGEASLLGAIIGMAQDFVGSNNINLLVPSGQFGSRNLGGDDSAQARYIFTYITPIVHYIFHKADTDLYTYNLDDGEKIEPMFYAPIIPMILVNGCSGIGTGWSSFIPQFNPIDIIANLYNMMSNSPLNSMTPWYRGFSGTIMKLGPNQWITKGTYILINATTVEITELPINCWTQKYKEFLCSIILSYQLTSNGTVAAAATSAKHKRSAAATSAKHKTTTATTTAPSYTTSYIYCGNPILKDYRELHADNKVRFVLTLDPAYITFALSTFADKKTEYISVFEKMFKLTTHISCKNTLNLYNEHNKLSHFTNVEDILRHYYSVRLALYHERLTLMQQELNHQTQLISIKARFIQDIIAGNINLNNQPRAYIISQLITLEYPTMLNNTLIPPLLVTDSDSDRYGAGGDCAPPCSPADADSTEEKRGSYNYLIQLPLSSLTSEKVAELLAEKDYLQLKLAELKGRTPQYLWKDDLKILEQQYANFMAEYCSDMNIFMPPTTKSKHIKLSRAT